MTIEVNNLSKRYGTQMAVNDLSFSSNGGEIIGFLGPNGAGKSTTFKMLTAYLTPSNGSIEINGLDIKKYPNKIRQSIGYLPESNPLYEDMYVKEFIQFISSLHRISLDKSSMDDLCEKVGILEERHKKISQLSKGYRQRVGLAQAIVHDPSILILDEPTTGLDVNQVVEIRKLIKELGRNKTILFSSHIMQEIEAVCDRVILLNKGQKILDSNIASLKVENLGKEEISLELAIPTKNIDDYRDLNGVESILTEDNRNMIIIAQSQMDIRNDIFKCAVKVGDIIIGMRKKDKSIEQVFQQLTKI